MQLESLRNLTRKWWFTPLAIALSTALTIPINGYFFGIYDHAYHLARLHWLRDPSLYDSTDPFVETLDAYPSLFWPLLLPLSRLVPEPWLFLSLYFLFRCLFGYAVLRFSRLLYASELVAWVAFSFFLLEKTTSGFYGLPDREFLPRTPVLPLTLFAMELYLRGRVTLALGLAGLLVNFHGRLAVHLVLLLGTSLLWRARNQGLTSLLKPALAAGVASAPALWWQFQHPSGVPAFPPDALWVSIVKVAVPSLQNLFVSEPAVLFMHLSSIGFVALFFLAARHPATPTAQRTLTVWMIGAAALILVAGIVTDIVPVPPLMQLELVRAGMFLPIIALPAFANAVVTAWRRRELAGGGALLLSLTGFFSPFGSWTALTAAMAWLPRRRTSGWLLPLVAVPVVVFSAYFFVFRHQTSQNWLVTPPSNAWSDLTTWAKENTSKDAVFLVPPYLDTAALGAEFRVAAERSNVVARHEGDLSGLNYHFALEWYQRMKDLSGGLDPTTAPLTDLSGQVKQGFLALPEAELLQVARKYGADYVVLERSQTLSLPLVYENRQFLVYLVSLR